MTGKVALLALLATLTTGGMVLAAAPEHAGPASMIVQGPGYQVSPMAIPGTRVEAGETATGAALTFTATPAGLADVRSRAQAMAERHNSGAFPGRGQRQGMMPPARARYESVPDGARVVFEAADPAQLDELRQAVREHADWMRSRPWVQD